MNAMLSAIRSCERLFPASASQPQWLGVIVLIELASLGSPDHEPEHEQRRTADSEDGATRERWVLGSALRPRWDSWQATERRLSCVCIGGPRERATGPGHQQEEGAEAKGSDPKAPGKTAARLCGDA